METAHHQCQLTGFRFVSLQDLSYEPDLYGMFPTDLLRRLKAIPFKVQEDTLTVALVNPYQSSVVKDLREAALRLKAGGVGYYPDRHFVHLDVGPVRHWSA